jgi:hypothetical protein
MKQRKHAYTVRARTHVHLRVLLSVVAKVRTRAHAHAHLVAWRSHCHPPLAHHFTVVTQVTSSTSSSMGQAAYAKAEADHSGELATHTTAVGVFLLLQPRQPLDAA